MFGGMASFAGYTSMFAFENITGELVIEDLCVPLDEREIFTVVFGVTLGTLIARSLRNVVCGVESLARGQSSCNFSVAVKALQRSHGAEFVTRRAIRCSGKGLVGPRKRAG